jgi:hypothetical protein
MADLKIEVIVRDNQTMSVYRVPRSGKINFVNASKTDQLVVTLKNPVTTPEIPTTWPFCDSNRRTEVNPLIVDKGSAKVVRICDKYTDDEVLYTAKIGNANAEDPIVIIEPYMTGPIFSLLRDPIVIIEAALVVLALALGYVLGKRRAARQAPASTGRP